MKWQWEPVVISGQTSAGSLLTESGENTTHTTREPVVQSKEVYKSSCHYHYYLKPFTSYHILYSPAIFTHKHLTLGKKPTTLKDLKHGLLGRRCAPTDSHLGTQIKEERLLFLSEP